MVQKLSKLARRCSRRFTGGVLRRFAKRQDGVAAVEFALVATPFFALLFAIMETALLFFAHQTLQTAVADSSRLILTGQAQSQGMSSQDFHDKICSTSSQSQSMLKGLFNCDLVSVNVQTFASFAAVTMANPVDANGNINKASMKFQPGDAGQICVVQIFYPWPVYVSLLGLSNLAGNNRLLAASAAFRVEPYH